MAKQERKMKPAEVLAGFAIPRLEIAGRKFEIREVVCEQQDAISEVIAAAGLEGKTELDLLQMDAQAELLPLLIRTGLAASIASLAITEAGKEWSRDGAAQILAFLKKSNVSAETVNGVALGFFTVNAGYTMIYRKTFLGITCLRLITAGEETRKRLGVPSLQDVLSRVNSPEPTEPPPSGTPSTAFGRKPSESKKPKSGTRG